MKNRTGRTKTKATKTNTPATAIRPAPDSPADHGHQVSTVTTASPTTPPNEETITKYRAERDREFTREVIRDAGRLQIELGDAKRQGQREEANRLRREIEGLGYEQTEAGDVEDRRSGKALKPTKVRRNARTRRERQTPEQRRDFNRSVAPRLARELAEKAGLLAENAHQSMDTRYREAMKVHHIAQVFGVHRNTMLKWLNDGTIRAKQCGRMWRTHAKRPAYNVSIASGEHDDAHGLRD